MKINDVQGYPLPWAIASSFCALVLLLEIIFFLMPREFTIISIINLCYTFLAETMFLVIGVYLFYVYWKQKHPDDLQVVKDKEKKYIQGRRVRKVVLGYQRKFPSMEQEMMFYNRGREILLSVISQAVFAILVYIAMVDYISLNILHVIIIYIVLNAAMLCFNLFYLTRSILVVPKRYLKKALAFGNFNRDEVNADYMRGKIFPIRSGLVNIGEKYFVCSCTKCCFILKMQEIREMREFKEENVVNNATPVAKLINYGVYLYHSYGTAKVYAASEDARGLIMDELTRHNIDDLTKEPLL